MLGIIVGAIIPVVSFELADLETERDVEVTCT